MMNTNYSDPIQLIAHRGSGLHVDKYLYGQAYLWYVGPDGTPQPGLSYFDVDATAASHPSGMDLASLASLILDRFVADVALSGVPLHERNSLGDITQLVVRYALSGVPYDQLGSTSFSIIGPDLGAGSATRIAPFAVY